MFAATSRFGAAGAHPSVFGSQRPVLLILDRSEDLGTSLRHWWVPADANTYPSFEALCSTQFSELGRPALDNSCWSRVFRGPCAEEVVEL